MKFDSSDMRSILELMNNRSEQAIRTYLDTSAIQMEDYARKNAPWTDRSGSARLRLNAHTEKRANGFRIVIAHGVSYGIFLELAHEKRFAIIPSTINYGTTKVIPGFNKLLERLRNG